MQSQTDAQTPGNLWTKKNGLRDIHSHTQGAKKILKGRSQSSHEKETLKNREARPGRVLFFLDYYYYFLKTFTLACICMLLGKWTVDSQQESEFHFFLPSRLGPCNHKVAFISESWVCSLLLEYL